MHLLDEETIKAKEAGEKTEEPSNGKEFTLIPDGYYTLMIDKAEGVFPNEEKENERKRAGKYLTNVQTMVTFTVKDAPYKKRKIWKRMLDKHDDPKIKKRAQFELYDLIVATGLDPKTVTGLHQLNNRVLVGRITTFKGRNGYKDSNQVVKFKNYLEHTAEVPQQTANDSEGNDDELFA